MLALACYCLMGAAPPEQTLVVKDEVEVDIRPFAVDATGTVATFEMRNRSRTTVQYFAFTKRTSRDGKYAQPLVHIYRCHEGKQVDIGEKPGWCGSCDPIGTRPLAPGEAILFDAKLRPGSPDDVLFVAVRGFGEVMGVRADSILD